MVGVSVKSHTVTVLGRDLAEFLEFALRLAMLRVANSFTQIILKVGGFYYSPSPNKGTSHLSSLTWF